MTSSSGVNSVSPSRIGRYTVLRKIGEGGMGEVYAARDERLGRTVAIKRILGGAHDDAAVRRFLREARAAAAVNHPHVCQLYDVDEHEGGWFLAMELLEGESLERRLESGPLDVRDALDTIREVLAALGALHEACIVHRDLKPSNVFLTPHGVKLLDFGLARQDASRLLDTDGETVAVTQVGTIVGTPRYMAPEQVEGGEVDSRTDVYAAGAILFEMLAGRPAFVGQTVFDVLYAALHEQPPALQGSPAVEAADRVIRRAMAKRAADRYPNGAAMAAALSDVAAISGASPGESATPVAALTRIVVPPFRILRPDPETDFLGFSLADAISTSLSSLPTLVVRSSALAGGISTERPDLRRLAADVDVDLVLLGTLVRAGTQIRAAAQLVETPAGTVVGAITAQAPVDDLFRLEDELSRKVADAIAPRLGARENRVARGVPRSARAYELFLRGNELARQLMQTPLARDMYLACLDEDPEFAPAWARLGRAYRVIGKYIEDRDANRARAEHALRRALELDPGLSVAHQYLTSLEAELGRASDAVGRLVRQLTASRHDAALLAGLVTACRYSGLFTESLAAHSEARRLDPHVPTGVAYTLLAAGEYDRLSSIPIGTGTEYDAFPVAFGAALTRNADRAKEIVAAGFAFYPAPYLASMESAIAVMNGDLPAARAAMSAAMTVHDDPEVAFMMAQGIAWLGDAPAALPMLERAVHGGFYALPALERFEPFAPLRADPAFVALADLARMRRDEARAAFVAEGGDRLLRG